MTRLPTIELEQSELRGGQRLPHALLTRVLSVCAPSLPKRISVISVAFVSEKEMRRLNKQYRGKDASTDVLSFEGWDEIFLCYPVLKRQAKQMGHTTRSEAVFLLVHGLLHLAGYDHLNPKDAARMFPLQARLLRKLGIDPRL